MKNNYLKITFLFLFVSFLGCKNNSDEPVPCTKTFVGDVRLTTQSEIDLFAQENYCIIEGNLIIGNDSDPNYFPHETSYTELDDLSALSDLTEVKGDLTILVNRQLRSLHGLENLTSIEGIFNARFNLRLTGIEELESLEYVGGSIELFYNQILTNINTFDQTRIDGGLHILGNFNLTTIGDFSETTSFQYITLDSNHGLNNLAGLKNITTVREDFIIRRNDALISLNGLENLITVENNFVLLANSISSLSGLSSLSTVNGYMQIQKIVSTDLKGLENLKTVDVMYIRDNNFLESLSGIENIENIKYLDIQDNNVLTSLTNFSFNTSIGPWGLLIAKNSSLTTLNGLENIMSFEGQMYIKENTSLRDFCALQNIVNNGIISLFNIDLNLHNPTISDISSGTNCSI